MPSVTEPRRPVAAEAAAVDEPAVTLLRRPAEWQWSELLVLLPLPSEQRWQLPAPVQINPELRSSGLCDPLLAVLQRRGYGDGAAIEALLNPAPAPDPAERRCTYTVATQGVRTQ